MKKIESLICLILLVVLFAVCSSPEKPLDKIEFIYNLEAAKKIAAEKDQPMVIEFYKENCPWCKMLDDSTFSNRVVIDMSQSMVFAKINALEDSLIARSLGVSYYPTIIVAKHDGSEVDRLVGYYPPSDFFNEVQLYLQGNETLNDYLVRLQDEPENVQYILLVGEKYRNRSQWETALEYYSNVIRLGSDNSYEIEQAAFEIAGIYDKMKEYTKAIAAYNGLIRNFPDSDKIEDALRRIPYCYAENGDYRNALRNYRKYLDDYPDGKYSDWAAKRVAELNRVFKDGR